MKDLLRPLGTTELRVSPLALGTVKFGRNTDVKYPTRFELPADNEIRSLLSLASDLGINLLDTAPAYGTSEARLGKLLSNRSDWLICTKAGEHYGDTGSHFDFSIEGVTRSIETSLARLKTDYLDLVLIHSDGHDLDILEQGNALEALTRARDAGKIRYIGMSTKTAEGGFAAIPHMDVLMVALNPDDLTQRDVIAAASDAGVGILLKKVFASGHTDPESSLRLALKEHGVSAVVTGTINPDHLKENAAFAEALLKAP